MQIKWRIALVVSFIVFPLFAFAEGGASVAPFRASIIEVVAEERGETLPGVATTFQTLKLVGLDGDYEGKEFLIDGIARQADTKILHRAGDEVFVLAEEGEDGSALFVITDIARLRPLFFLGFLFVLVILAIGRMRGIRALFGLVFSFFVITAGIIPGILAGHDPVFVSLGYATVIVLVSTYMVYGFNKKATVAIAGMFAGTVIVGILSVVFTHLARLSGYAAEETMFLAGLLGGAINFEGLLLAGFIVGTLGVLDDLAVSQVSVVVELQRADPTLSRRELFRRAMRVGVDHIASMVNTLFLAYAGASLPLLLLFRFQEAPFWNTEQVLNHEIIATEIVRTLVGSIGLALTVPITTILAAYAFASMRARNAPRAE
jgi:uncharacterized membrane protein